MVGGLQEEQKKKTVQQEMAKAGPGLLEPDMELFCKAAADGNALGDCPFTHYIHVRFFFKFFFSPCDHFGHQLFLLDMHGLTLL